MVVHDVLGFGPIRHLGFVVIAVVIVVAAHLKTRPSRRGTNETFL
jgi:hypothetical protein